MTPQRYEAVTRVRGERKKSLPSLPALFFLCGGCRLSGFFFSPGAKNCSGVFGEKRHRSWIRVRVLLQFCFTFVEMLSGFMNVCYSATQVQSFGCFGARLPFFSMFFLSFVDVTFAMSACIFALALFQDLSYIIDYIDVMHPNIFHMVCSFYMLSNVPLPFICFVLPCVLSCLLSTSSWPVKRPVILLGIRTF